MIIIVGNGGHAKVVREAIRPYYGAIQMCAHHKDLLNQESILPRDCSLINGIGKHDARIAAFNELKAADFDFIWIRHESAIIPPVMKIDEGSQIMAGAVLQPGCEIGRNVLINTRASVDHDCIIGDHVHIAPGAILCGGVTVGDGVFIGAGAIIPEGRHVPVGEFVKAGTVFK